MTLGNGLITIGVSAFIGMNSQYFGNQISSRQIPNSVKTIYMNAFTGIPISYLMLFPFNFPIFGYRFGDLEPDTRSRIEMRDHRSAEEQKPIKAFFLDLMLDARNNGDTDRVAALGTDLFSNKFDQIVKYELNSVDPPVLKKFLELLNEEKIEKFMNLVKPKSN